MCAAVNPLQHSYSWLIISAQDRIQADVFNYLGKETEPPFRADSPGRLRAAREN